MLAANERDALLAARAVGAVGGAAEAAGPARAGVGGAPEARALDVEAARAVAARDELLAAVCAAAADLAPAPRGHGGRVFGAGRGRADQRVDPMETDAAPLRPRRGAAKGDGGVFEALKPARPRRVVEANDRAAPCAASRRA